MSLREMVTENLRLKALSLLLAALLWLSVTSGTEGEAGVTVPVRFRNIPPQLSVGNATPIFVELRIAGPKLLLTRLKKERLAATLDLQGVGAGTVAFTRLESTIPLQNGLRITRINPAAIELELVKREGKTGP